MAPELTAFARDYSLLRGQGLDLGPYAGRYPEEQRTMLRVIADRAASHGGKDWLVFDGSDLAPSKIGGDVMFVKLQELITKPTDIDRIANDIETAAKAAYK